MSDNFAKRRRAFTEVNPGSLRSFVHAQDQYSAAMRQREAHIRDHADECGGEFAAGIDYDLNHAATVSGRTQLLRFGIIPVPPQELNGAEDLHDELWTVIEGLACAGVFLINTDHMSDGDLYARLYFRILEEPTKLIPESICAEFIDCLHPMDEVHPRGKRMAERKADANTIMQDGPRDQVRGPICERSSDPDVMYDRDAHLPRTGKAVEA